MASKSFSEICHPERWMTDFRCRLLLCCTHVGQFMAEQSFAALGAGSILSFVEYNVVPRRVGQPLY